MNARPVTHAGIDRPDSRKSRLVETDRALVEAGQRLVVVADHTKWGTVGISTIAALGEADVLVTDDGLPDDARAVLTGEVDELVLAPVREGV